MHYVFMPAFGFSSFALFQHFLAFSISPFFKRMAQDARVKWDFIFISYLLGFWFLYFRFTKKGVGWVVGEGEGW